MPEIAFRGRRPEPQIPDLSELDAKIVAGFQADAAAKIQRAAEASRAAQAASPLMAALAGQPKQANEQPEAGREAEPERKPTSGEAEREPDKGKKPELTPAQQRAYDQYQTVRDLGNNEEGRRQLDELGFGQPPATIRDCWNVLRLIAEAEREDVPNFDAWRKRLREAFKRRGERPFAPPSSSRHAVGFQEACEEGITHLGTNGTN